MSKEEESAAAPQARRVRVQVHESAAQTPSQQVTAKANETHEVRDSRGRRIVLKRPGVLAQYRLVEVLGATAENKVYMSMTMPLLFVVSIDGEPVHPPATKREIEALVQLLDDDGLAAVIVGVEKHYADKENGASEKDRIKN